MPRPSKGPRLYFDRNRDVWVIREGSIFIRTGTDNLAAADRVLSEYLDGRKVAVVKPRAWDGHVYFVSAEVPDFPVKIGFTERLNNVRLQSLQTGSPYPLVMLAAMPGAYHDENGLHKRFAHDRMCGEWFRRSNELMEIINGLNAAKEIA